MDNKASPQMDDEMFVSASRTRISRGAVNPRSPEKEKKNKKKTVIRYMECMKNHAAAIGGNARDGCGEFMPSNDEQEDHHEQEEGSPQSLVCSACGCHRNFHRKEVQFNGETISPCNHYCHNFPSSPSAFVSNNHVIMGASTHLPSMQPLNNEFCNITLPTMSSSLEKTDKNMLIDNEKARKKRFRTKFTEDQKEKMVRFAEQAGWRMQNLDKSMVEEFCEEVGIKRRVLKVWVHNNKHHYLSKKLEPS